MFEAHDNCAPTGGGTKLGAAPRTWALALVALGPFDSSGCDTGELDDAESETGDTEASGNGPSAEELAGQYRGPGGCEDIEELDNALTLDAAYAGRFQFVREYSYDPATGMCVAPSDTCDWDVVVEVTQNSRLVLTLTSGDVCPDASAECIYYETGLNCELTYTAPDGVPAEATVDLRRM